MAKFYTPTRLSENIAETPEGYLLCLAVPIARTGWQLYAEGECPLKVGPNGTVNVYRSDREVFRPQTIASFQGKAITIRHPSEFVDPKSHSVLSKGSLQNVRRGEDKDEDGERSMLADLLITDDFAIQLIRNGLREVSCGYDCEWEQMSETTGEQFNIVGNHCALVEEGRAGPSYAINDHKGKVNEMTPKLLDILKKRFGSKVIDEAMAEEKKEDKKTEDAPTVSNQSYDELVKAVKDMGEKVDNFAKSKDEWEKEKPAAKDEPKPEPKKEEQSKDEPASMEDRMKAVELAITKLLESKAGDEEESEEGEDEESDTDEGEDDDFEESEMTGDTAARIEILSPGMKAAKGKDLRADAILSAYKTKDGKEVIDSFTGGKKPVLDSAEKINAIFIASSEVLKSRRGNGLAGTKDVKSAQARAKAMDGDSAATGKTVDEINEMNAAHWARK